MTDRSDDIPASAEVSAVARFQLTARTTEDQGPEPVQPQNTTNVISCFSASAEAVAKAPNV